MLIPRFIRTRRRLTAAEAEKLKAQLQAQLAAAEDNARRHVERQTRAGLLFTREDHEAALEKLKWDAQKEHDENARKIIDTWRERLRLARDSAREVEAALESAKLDAEAWRLRALTAENELAATEGQLETSRLATEDARAMLRRRQEHAAAQAEHTRQAAEVRRHDKIRWDAWKARGQSMLAVVYPDGSKLCTLPPKGQWCPLDDGHAGPCPTRPVEVKL